MNLKIRYYNSSDFDTLIRLLEKVYESHINQVTLEKNYISDKRSILVVVTEEDDVQPDLLIHPGKLRRIRPFARPVVDHAFRHRNAVRAVRQAHRDPFGSRPEA